MGQLGFFDADKRLQALSARGDPLEAIDHLVPWESFRAEIEAVVLTPDELKKSSAGRKPFDAILMFRMLVLQALNNLSDEQVEYQVRDRLSFSRFLGLAIEDSIPDATTLWLFREKLARAGLIEQLFDRFDQHLAAKGYMARGGQIIDASIVLVPTQRNSRDENAELQAGRTPAGWKQKPAKVRQKDRDARWTKKHGRSFFGYKNHVNADAKHKLIRHYAVTDAAVHDSQELDGLLDKGNTCKDVFADGAYRSAKIETKLRASGYNSRIHRRGRRNHPLSLAQMRVNYAKSRIRARIEHVFGAQQNAPGGRIVRTIGIVRARDSRVSFVRANLLMAGMIFSGDLGTDIVFDYGLFSPNCRRLDLADVKKLDMQIDLRMPHLTGDRVFPDWDGSIGKLRATWEAIASTR